MQKLRIFWQVFRWQPTLSWAGSSVIIGILMALAKIEITLYNFGIATLIALIPLLLHGVVSHAYNDWYDWDSGTDLNSPGILSGGSGVLTNSLLAPKELLDFGDKGLFLAVIFSGLLIYYKGLIVLLFLVVGVWSAYTYTKSPFLFAYRPFLGEWLAAWPGLVMATVATYYLLTEEINLIVLWSAIIHSLFAIALLMHHHVPDVSADKEATPPKVTTVVWVKDNYGTKALSWPALIYFSLSSILALIGYLYIDSIFLVSFVIGMILITIVLITDYDDIAQISKYEKGLILVIIIHAISLGLEVLI
ncbi:MULTISPECIES: prenyltransferase [unclassified Candidatus Frackibacter]|uniref:prenyltransferase n=1 Tax=unclassified Candidatus Frackibacter TaxID=2648818 RepID=UPI000795136F|nr:MULTISPECIES: prenyltransferase [unclassified Candidatus Frackibacter]KXS45471.1 MAG: 1,4-dihydroxy-2-naphthoate octaprenyltransferase [Candidatus Frackibacter sp. T328-2]SDC01098.1 1,4-dihydroxy-2-naphthoate octaprenyltransferase [Candidatus Frackibacter sp. WG11]SFL37347.1 1,4-dihydroxy-2-naphthoate octaprenyltransferase [Candidatus Frackibacter sp. WG13]